jgi:hypothetical protein
MDPLGFALENFDAIGHWRNEDAGFPIDSAGGLPDGTRVRGPAELRRALMAHPDEFAKTTIEKLLTYAIGRGVDYADGPVIRHIAREAAPDYRWSTIVLGIVKSVPFQMKAKKVESSNGAGN